MPEEHRQLTLILLPRAKIVEPKSRRIHFFLAIASGQEKAEISGGFREVGAAINSCFKDGVEAGLKPAPTRFFASKQELGDQKNQKRRG